MGESTVLAKGTEVGELLEDFQPFSSTLQLEVFVLGAAGVFHPWGMYKQVLRELDARHRSLREYVRQIGKLDRDCPAPPPSPDQPEYPQAHQNWEEHWDKLWQLQRTEKDCRREHDTLLVRARELKAVIGELTPERRTALELDFWAHKHAYDLGLAIEARQGPPRGIFEVLPGFPTQVRRQLLRMLREPLLTREYLAGILDPVLEDHTQLFAERFAESDKRAKVLALEEARAKNALLERNAPQQGHLAAGDAGYRDQPPVVVSSGG